MENRQLVIATTDFSDRLELFFGEASDAVCHVYARLQGHTSEQGLRLRGTLTGPSCLYSHTLPATFSFLDRGPGKSLLAGATVPEPCFWTPEMPHCYQAVIELCRDDEVLARTQRTFGIRTLGARGRKLVYDGKGWVLRAVDIREVPSAELDHWRDCDAAMLVRNPDEALCQQASHIGVLLVAELDLADPVQIRRLSRSPAVAMVVLPNASKFDLAGLAHNLLLAERFAPQQPLVPAPWAHAAFCELSPGAILSSPTLGCELPVIMFRSAGQQAGVEQARALCDRLQRDLARCGEIAGYIV